MAALALFVAVVGRDECDFFFVTALAGRVVGERAHEIVLLVALLAVGSAMKALVGGGSLMTAAARACSRCGVPSSRMGIVAADTSSDRALLGMIGMHVLVAVGA